MNRWGKNGSRWLRPMSVALLLSSLSLVGCGKKPAAEQGGTKPEQSAGADAVPQNSATAAPAGSSPTTATPVAAYDPLHQSFADATRGPENPPTEDPLSGPSPRPPDMTLTNKPTPKILEQVQKEWDHIRFVDAAGKPIHYSATIEVEDLGVIEIDLKHEVAPNHVRNFIALARAGYYDGLRFDRISHQKSKAEDGQTVLKLDLIKGGCPLGTGETESGHIGYWLKPEFNSDEKHEEGTVGACHGYEPDTAGTRFYITLNKADYLDGSYTVFGRVRSGLDVVRRIAEKPVIEEEQEREDCRPKTPIIIKKVTIHANSRAGAEG